MSHTRIAIAITFLISLVGCATHPAESLYPPNAPREFRAAWVATVDNIDWPSSPGLPADQQQREIIAILDKAKALNLNAIILQVRTSCDAFYPSQYEPWSYYLTGAQGKPPAPLYDPLQMWIVEAHRRGLELHAWFNPFRAKHKKSPNKPDYEPTATHVSHTQPNLVKRYGSVMWLDPGEQAAQEQTLRVMADVVQRYDIDGVHIDDYFYPYQEKDAAGKLMDFPDDESWRRYQQSGGKLSRGDWRRDNINQLVRRMYVQTKQLKPWVKVGISPFGIWRPGNPPVVKGFDAYDSIYADSRLWLNQGWVDYLTPQLYWKVSAPAQPYEALLRWWAGENRHSRHLWPGMYTSRITPSPAAASWMPRDIVDEIEVTRRTPGATGHVHFSMIALVRDHQGVDEALQPVYALPALVPASPWLGGKKPATPRVGAVMDAAGGVTIEWMQGDASDKPWLWVLCVKRGDAWEMHICPATQLRANIAPDARFGEVTAVSVSAVDRIGNESEPTEGIAPAK